MLLIFKRMEFNKYTCYKILHCSIVIFLGLYWLYKYCFRVDEIIFNDFDFIFPFIFMIAVTAPIWIPKLTDLLCSKYILRNKTYIDNNGNKYYVDLYIYETHGDFSKKNIEIKIYNNKNKIMWKNFIDYYDCHGEYQKFIKDNFNELNITIENEQINKRAIEELKTLK